jgi:hypothetical protein
MTTPRDPAVQFLQHTAPTALKVLVTLAVFHDRNGPEAAAALHWLCWAAKIGSATATRTTKWLEHEGLVQTFYIKGDKHLRLTAAAAQLPLPLSITPPNGESHQNDDSLVHSPTTATVLSIKYHTMDNLPVEKESHQNDDSLSFADQTARVLVKLGGVLYDQALDAVQTALEQGDKQADVLSQIEQWSGWIAAHMPEVIPTMGLSIAKNLQKGAWM